MSGVFEEVTGFLPLEFFSVNLELQQGKITQLPNMSELLSEQYFADVNLCWQKKGFTIHVDVKQPFEGTFFPQYLSGDAIELFLSTRILNKPHALNRFCHHFLILPEKENEIQVRELTRLRSEQMRPLADPELFTVQTIHKKNSYILEVDIPNEALYGFDPHETKTIGFNYRISRMKGEKQHFALSSKRIAIERYPYYWATIGLT